MSRKNPYFSIFTYLTRNNKYVIPVFIIFFASTILLTNTLTIIFSIPYTIYENKNYLKDAVFVRVNGIEYKFAKDKIDFNEYIKDQTFVNRAFIIKEIFKKHASVNYFDIFPIFIIEDNDIENFLRLSKIKIKEKTGSGNGIMVHEDLLTNLKISRNSLFPINDAFLISKNLDLTVNAVLSGNKKISLISGSSFENLKKDLDLSVRLLINNFLNPTMVIFYKDLEEKNILLKKLNSDFNKEYFSVMTFESLKIKIDEGIKAIFKLFYIVEILALSMLGFITGLLFYIYNRKRIAEFGLYLFLGYSKTDIVKKVSLETLFTILSSLIFAVPVSILINYLVYIFIFAPYGEKSLLIDLNIMFLNLPLVAIVFLSSVITIIMNVSNLDLKNVMETK